MKFTRYLKISLILSILLLGSFLYIKNRYLSNDLLLWKNYENQLDKEFNQTNKDIDKYISYIPQKTAEIEKLTEELKNTKKTFDSSKLRPGIRYTVTTRRNGNHTSNYIKYY